MNSDIRLQMSFYNNTKVKRLHRTLGADAVLSLIYLWLYTAENRPHGELRGMDEIDISVAAQWGGEPSTFVGTLCDMRFLDKKRGLYLVHDWQTNNPWAFDAPSRSEKAKKAAEAKWAKRNGKKACAEHDLAMLDDARGYAPSPSPSPSPKEEEAVVIPFDGIMSAYNKFCPDLPRSIDINYERRNLIKAAYLKYLHHPIGVLNVFDKMFKNVQQSAFLKGQVPGHDGKRFRFRINWMFEEKNMSKILEGDYNDAPQPDPAKREFVF